MVHHARLTMGYGQFPPLHHGLEHRLELGERHTHGFGQPAGVNRSQPAQPLAELLGKRGVARGRALRIIRKCSRNTVTTVTTVTLGVCMRIFAVTVSCVYCHRTRFTVTTRVTVTGLR